MQTVLNKVYSLYTPPQMSSIIYLDSLSSEYIYDNFTYAIMDIVLGLENKFV